MISTFSRDDVGKNNAIRYFDSIPFCLGIPIKRWEGYKTAGFMKGTFLIWRKTNA